ncbi:MAG: DUF1080 domain-containing protein [Sediminicola sp.]
MLLSCKDVKVANSEERIESLERDSVIVHKEYIGTEPTTPEATEYYVPEVPKVKTDVNGGPPSDAIVLFDGTDLDRWITAKGEKQVEWILNDDGSMTVADNTGSIRTKQKFGDIQLHIEWKSSQDEIGEGQHYGNSGIFLSGMYEIQILDNNRNDTYVNGMVGSIYKQSPPLAMASVPTGEWNSFDIVYHAPMFNKDGEKIISGTVTLFHNGILIQDHSEIKGTTQYIGWPKNPAHGDGPLILQAHGDNGKVSPVSYRNIWLREL